MEKRKTIIGIFVTVCVICTILMIGFPKNEKVKEAINFVETYSSLKDINVDKKKYKILEDKERTTTAITVIGNFDSSLSRDYIIRIGKDNAKRCDKNEYYVDVIFNDDVGLFAYDVRNSNTNENGFIAIPE